MPKPRVFVDTNVVIEAFRIGCWEALCHRFSIETVEAVIRESQAGDPTNPRYIPVDLSRLCRGLSAVHQVQDIERAELALVYPNSSGLDVGERDLLAWIHSREKAGLPLLLLSTADKLAIVMAGQLSLLDQLRSLQDLATEAGVSRSQVGQIKDQFGSAWLIQTRTQVRLGTIPGP